MPCPSNPAVALRLHTYGRPHGRPDLGRAPFVLPKGTGYGLAADPATALRKRSARTAPALTQPGRPHGALEQQAPEGGLLGAGLAFAIVAFRDRGPRWGRTPISDLDGYNGESHDAEVALDRAGLRPQSEVVFIQSDKLTIKDPQFEAAVADVARTLPKIPYVQNVQSPLRGESAVSEDGHAALVNFDVAGDSVEAKKRIDPILAATAAAQKRHPALACRAVRQREREQGGQRRRSPTT